ncbi:hypothetical protein WMF37_25645 [Sorangium sp. So ce291]|uniref:hypothetical protein n=1 Tax=Sorangium sp. So ce291 TaxID=3133294 RepID=UPI003F614E37
MMDHQVNSPRSDISAEVRQLHRELSPASAAWLDFAEREPDARQRHGFAPFERSPLIHYPLHAWPTLVDARRVERMAEAARGMARAVRSLPRRVLGGDPAQVAAFYDIDVERAAGAIEAMSLSGDARGAISRGDFIDTGDGLKCLELNVVAAVGGWETMLQAMVVLGEPVVQRFVAQCAVRVKPANSLLAFFRNVLDQARGVVPWEGECNIGILLSDSDLPPPNAMEMASAFLNGQYADFLGAHGARGEILLASYGQLEEAEGRLSLRGKRLHALLEFNARDRLKIGGPEFVARTWAALRSRSVALFNGPAADILDDKRNLALLSEHQDGDLLAPEDRDAARRFVPWTRVVAPVEVTRGQERVYLPELLAGRREDLVLKLGRDFGGDSVVIGRSATTAAWDKAVAQALEQPRAWVVQEQVVSRPYHYLRSDGVVAPHTVIWGLFVMGDTFAGSMVRVGPDADSSGVVNVQQGAAAVGVVIEVE